MLASPDLKTAGCLEQFYDLAVKVIGHCLGRMQFFDPVSNEVQKDMGVVTIEV
jgi:hypothetical protein